MSLGLDPPAVYGLDLSLTATGIALSPRQDETYTLKPTVKGVPRLHWIRNHIIGICRTPPALVVIEDLFAGGHGGVTIELAKLHGTIQVALYSNRVRFMVVSPQHLKMYATGKGSSPKAAVIAATVKRLGIEPGDDNQADAAWLRALGCALLGQPVTTLPDTHTRALNNLTLPPT